MPNIELLLDKKYTASLVSHFVAFVSLVKLL